MGREISDRHQVLAGQLGKAYRILPVYIGYTTHDLYHQCRRGLSPPSTESDKNKGVFPNDTALEKLVYLAYRNIRKKWTMPIANWAAIAQQLAIKFGDRFKLW